LTLEHYYKELRQTYIKVNTREFANTEHMTKNDFSQIYEIYHKRVFEFLCKRVSNKEIAEDLASEVFEKIFKTMNDFQWQGVTVSAWIFRIARNHLIDYYRKNNKHKGDTSLEDIINLVVSTTPTIDTEMEKGETEVYLFNAIRELEADDQYLIYYKFYEEMSNIQISELTGMTETNIGTRLHRIRRFLAKAIKNHEKSG